MHSVQYRALANLEEGNAPTPSSLFFDHISGSQGLDDRDTPPPPLLSEGRYQPLESIYID